MVDGVNSILIASRSTDAPMRFVNFKQKNDQPPTPSAMVADILEDGGASYYRDAMLPLRTPTIDSEMYTIDNNICGPLMVADRARWKGIRLAQPLFEDFKLLWGFESYSLSKPSDSIYPASSALDISKYVEQEELVDSADILQENFVQYAPVNDGDRKTNINFHSFFGGDLYRDRKIGRKSVAVKES